MGLVAVLVLLCLMWHIRQHPPNQAGTSLGPSESIFLNVTSSLQGLTCSLTQEMSNTSWRFMHMEAKSCFLQCLCRADLFGARLCLWPPGTRGIKSPLSGSNCHLYCFQCWSSSALAASAQGLSSVRATNHRAAIVGMSCFFSQEYPDRHTSKYCLKFLQFYCSSGTLMLHHTGGTASLWTDVVPADTQLAMHGYWNSPSCHPVQFNLMLLCLTQTLCLICCLPTYLNAGQQRSRSHQSRQPSMLDYILLFAIRNTNLKTGASMVSFFFFLYFTAAEHNRCQHMQCLLSWTWNHERP